MKYILSIILCSVFVTCYAQHNYSYKKKTYIVYYSFAEADKVNPDSVFGLVLKSKGYKKFPRQILKYKNLQILDLTAIDWDEAYYDSLMTNAEIKKREKLMKKLGDVLYYPPCFRRNRIFDFPVYELMQLKKLIYLNLDCCGRSTRQLCDLMRMMPQLEINPNVEYDRFNEVTGVECFCRPDGRYFTYYPNGNKKTEFDVVGELLDGDYIDYSENGSKAAQYTYQCGEPVGFIIYYNDKNEITRKDTIR